MHIYDNLYLTYFTSSRMAFHTLIDWTSPFPFYGLFGCIVFIFIILIEHSVNPYQA